jgi:RecA/RadA recombinase
MSFFDNLIKAADNKYASRVSDGNDADIATFIDTGSYSLNAILSGSIYGGLPSNKVTALAGSPSTGKTFYALNVAKEFLLANKDSAVFYFESESAVTTDILEERGIDTEKFFIIPVVTIQDFRSQAVRILDSYLEEDEKNRKPLLMVLDSLGMLSTAKEVADIAEGKDTRDMTRAQLIRGAFRVLTLKMGRAKVALLVTNHTYDVVGSYVPMKEMSGGDGLKYAASTIIFLSKSKKRDDSTKEVTGAIITVKNHKSRLTVENKDVETLLDYKTGLNKYYGLLEIADKHGILKRIANKYQFPDGKSAFEKAIYKDPEKYFTKDVLDKIDEAAKKEFMYGSAQEDDEAVAE